MAEGETLEIAHTKTTNFVSAQSSGVTAMCDGAQTVLIFFNDFPEISHSTINDNDNDDKRNNHMSLVREQIARIAIQKQQAIDLIKIIASGYNLDVTVSEKVTASDTRHG